MQLKASIAGNVTPRTAIAKLNRGQKASKSKNFENLGKIKKYLKRKEVSKKTEKKEVSIKIRSI